MPLLCDQWDMWVRGLLTLIQMVVLLLQQSLNMLQGETKPIRRLIEARFDDIKGITESQQPYLEIELSAW